MSHCVGGFNNPNFNDVHNMVQTYIHTQCVCSRVVIPDSAKLPNRALSVPIQLADRLEYPVKQKIGNLHHGISITSTKNVVSHFFNF